MLVKVPVVVFVLLIKSPTNDLFVILIFAEFSVSAKSSNPSLIVLIAFFKAPCTLMSAKSFPSVTVQHFLISAGAKDLNKGANGSLSRYKLMSATDFSLIVPEIFISEPLILALVSFIAKVLLFKSTVELKSIKFKLYFLFVIPASLTRTEPAVTVSPAYFFIPKYFGFASRPFLAPLPPLVLPSLVSCFMQA